MHIGLLFTSPNQFYNTVNSDSRTANQPSAIPVFPRQSSSKQLDTITRKSFRYYYKEILKTGMRRWSKLPQARHLFNTPYHGAAPRTSDDYVSKILRHLKHCGINMCSCILEEYFRNSSTAPSTSTDVIIKDATTPTVELQDMPS